MKLNVNNLQERSLCESESWCKWAKNKVVKHACTKQRKKGKLLENTQIPLLPPTWMQLLFSHHLNPIVRTEKDSEYA